MCLEWLVDDDVSGGCEDKVKASRLQLAVKLNCIQSAWSKPLFVQKPLACRQYKQAGHMPPGKILSNSKQLLDMIQYVEHLYGRGERVEAACPTCLA